jgi:hypothetical protein
MSIVIYILAGISILVALGGLVTYSETKHPGLLISSVVSIVFATFAIYLVHWWPLVVGFAANWGLRLLRLDPGYKR